MAISVKAQPQPAPPHLLRPQEAAEVLAISPRKLWELTNSGRIRCVRIDRSVRYDIEDLRISIERAKRSGGQAPSS